MTVQTIDDCDSAHYQTRSSNEFRRLPEAPASTLTTTSLPTITSYAFLGQLSSISTLLQSTKLQPRRLLIHSTPTILDLGPRDQHYDSTPLVSLRCSTGSTQQGKHSTPGNLIPSNSSINTLSAVQLAGDSNCSSGSLALQRLAAPHTSSTGGFAAALAALAGKPGER